MTSNFTAAQLISNSSKGRSGGGNSEWLSKTNSVGAASGTANSAALTGRPQTKSGHPYQAPGFTSKRASGQLASGRLPRASAPWSVANSRPSGRNPRPYALRSPQATSSRSVPSTLHRMMLEVQGTLPANEKPSECTVPNGANGPVRAEAG